MVLAIIDGDVLLYTSMWGSASLEEGKEKFESNFNDILNSLFTKDYVMALGGPNNFRRDLYKDYKMSNSRVKSKSHKPVWFNDLKSWVIQSYEGAILTENCEADDMLRVWALEADNANINRCVVTVDKDLNCISGSHYNPRTKTIYQISEKDASCFYWKQLLMGDPVDNIPGIPGIGPKKAEKILEGLSGNNEYKVAVCNAYHDHYGDSGFEHMLINGKLLHIWRKLNDHFKIGKEVYESAIIV